MCKLTGVLNVSHLDTLTAQIESNLVLIVNIMQMTVIIGHYVQFNVYVLFVVCVIILVGFHSRRVIVTSRSGLRRIEYRIIVLVKGAAGAVVMPIALLVARHDRVEIESVLMILKLVMMMMMVLVILIIAVVSERQCAAAQKVARVCLRRCQVLFAGLDVVVVVVVAGQSARVKSGALNKVVT